MTGVVGWAAELTESVIADVAGTLLGPSVFGQLREMSAASYSLVDGAAVKTIAHSSVASGGFVSEGEPIQVGALLIGPVNLPAKKAALIVAITNEVLRGSAANVQNSLQQLLAEDLALAIDAVLLDAVAADAIRHAGLRFGVAGLTPAASGTPSEKTAADIKALVGAIMPSSRPVLIAAGAQAASLSVLTAGLPLIAAPTLAVGTIIAVDANSFVSVIGAIDLAASGEPVIHMSDAPLPISTVGSPATIAAPTSSMFQTDATSLRCIQYINWAMRCSVVDGGRRLVI